LSWVISHGSFANDQGQLTNDKPDLVLIVEK